MISTIINKLPVLFKSFFIIGHPRSIKVKKNIIASFGLKGLSLVIGFLLVPLTLNYIDVTRYGIWLTLSSIIGWFGFFDIGLGNGLRNKFAEAIAKDQKELARTYVSTTYAVLLIIVGIVYLCFLVINPFLNWVKILNAPPDMFAELSKLVYIVFTFFALRFIFNLIGIILVADQKPAINNGFNVIGSFLSLVTIYILTKTTSGSLLYLGTTLSAVPVIVLLIASLIFYNRDYNYYKPSFKYVDFKHFKDLAGLGFKFFILNISGLIMFSTDNIIITQLLGPAEVTSYNIARKYFFICVMIFNIILMPYWSAYTEAFYKNDFKWIRGSIKRFLKIWSYCVLLIIIMILFSNRFYLLWVGDKVTVPISLSIGMGLYVIFRTWNDIFSHFQNGISKIRLQIYYAIFGAIINIPLSIFMARNLNFGSTGVILATSLSLLCGVVLSPIQYKKIITRTAKGIWAR